MGLVILHHLLCQPDCSWPVTTNVFNPEQCKKHHLVNAENSTCCSRSKFDCPVLRDIQVNNVGLHSVFHCRNTGLQAILLHHVAEVSDTQLQWTNVSLSGVLYNKHKHTYPFNNPLSGTTWVSQYQKGKKPIWILLKQETVSGSGISCAICKSAPCSRQITTPAPHHSVFYRPDALPAAQPTATNHWRQLQYNKHKTKY